LSLGPGKELTIVVHFCYVRVDIQRDGGQEESVQASINGVETFHLPNRCQSLLHHEFGFVAHINLLLHIIKKSLDIFKASS
jgi:hypothetical protein